MLANQEKESYGVLVGALSRFFFASCFFLVSCCFLAFSLSFFPPLSPIVDLLLVPLIELPRWVSSRG